MDIVDKTALVTGANRGLGRALVAALLAQGARRVYASARDPESLAQTLAFDPARVIPIRIDITEPSSIAAAARTASDVQLLVNNAGVLDYANPLDVTGHIIDRNMATNLHGTLAMSRAFTPVIEAAGGGGVVNILSFLCFVSAPIFSAYNASKAASWSMAMSLRPYLAARGIAVVNVFPTTIDTDMVAALDKAKDTPADVANDIVKGIMSGQEDVFPAGAITAFNAWRADHKAVEEKFSRIV